MVTIDAVIIEFTKGALNEQKLVEKQEFVNEIVESYLPITKDTFDRAKKLVALYKADRRFF